MSRPDLWLLCDPYCAQFKCYHEEEIEMNENEEPSVTEAELARVTDETAKEPPSPNSTPTPMNEALSPQQSKTT